MGVTAHIILLGGDFHLDALLPCRDGDGMLIAKIVVVVAAQMDGEGLFKTDERVAPDGEQGLSAFLDGAQR